MARYGSVSRLVAWTGVAPGHDASVGKQHSGKPAKAIASYIQTALTQLAHAAARAKETYLSTLYQRLAARRGRKRWAAAFEAAQGPLAGIERMPMIRTG